jgi:hypothetical protein
MVAMAMVVQELFRRVRSFAWLRDAGSSNWNFMQSRDCHQVGRYLKVLHDQRNDASGTSSWFIIWTPFHSHFPFEIFIAHF